MRFTLQRTAEWCAKGLPHPRAVKIAPSLWAIEIESLQGLMDFAREVDDQLVLDQDVHYSLRVPWADEGPANTAATEYAGHIEIYDDHRE